MSKTDEHYTRLMGSKAYDKPCLICGATHRDPTGQDPCIKDLPGVLHACCGHGYEEGYVAFENGTHMKGQFTREPQLQRARYLELNKQWIDT